MILVYVDGHQLELPQKSTPLDLIIHYKKKGIVGCTINGKPHDLTTPLSDQDQVVLLDFSSRQGKEIFWHSSAHLLAQAILRLWPHAQPAIGPPIEEGFYYDFGNLEISENDFPTIEATIRTILRENTPPQRKEFSSPTEALSVFGSNPYKKELIDELGETTLSAYQQGEFCDLCRGPHLPHLGMIGAYKLLKISGAYWRGDPSNPMLTRVYGISFPSQQELNLYLKRIEEAKKRDHRLLGSKLDLFSFSEYGPGFPFIHPKGMIFWNALLNFYHKIHTAAGYQEIKTPILLSHELWKTSGHWDHYKQNMYLSEVEKHDFALKPMNCPGCMLLYKKHVHSYKELPLRLSEIGFVHRHEASGALSGLMRVRGFHQDDAHIFLTLNQVEEEIFHILELIDTIYSTFGLQYRCELSTKPEKNTIGTDDQWEVATRFLKQALEKKSIPFIIQEGEGAFYGPKIDIHIQDCLGRSWQCGTIQVDMFLPSRFDLRYDAPSGEETPIVIHRALLGSIERFWSILIEHFAGRFPLWCNPRQIAVIPVSDKHKDYAQYISTSCKKYGFYSDLLDHQESVSKKIRHAQTMQYNYMIILGDTEIEQQQLSVRTREGAQKNALSLQAFIDALLKEQTTYALTSPYTLD